MGKRFIPIVLTGDDKQVVATFTRTFDLIESRAKRLNSSLNSISKEAARVAREVDATLRAGAAGGGASPLRNIPSGDIPNPARAARDVEQINAQTMRQVQQQAAFRENIAQRVSRTEIEAERRKAQAVKSSLQDELRERQANARAAEQSVQRIQAAGRGLAVIGAGLTATLTLPLVAGGRAAIDSAVKFDSLKRGLFAVEGSAEAVERRMKSLREIAKLPGIGFEEAIQGSVRLQAVGFSAERSEKALIQFANAVALTGGGRSELERITVQLGQMSSKSKILAQDLKPIIEAAPAVGKALKQAFGTVDSEELSRLGLTTERFIDRLVGELEKLPRVSGGAKNSIENFYDTADIAFSKLGNAILPPFTAVLNLAAFGLEKLSDGFELLPEPVQRTIVFIGAVLAVLGPLTLAIAGVVSVIGFVKAQLLVLAPALAKAGLEMSSLTKVVSLANLGWAALGILLVNLAVSLYNWATSTREVNIVSRQSLELTQKRIASGQAELTTIEKQNAATDVERAKREALIAAKQEELAVNQELAKAQQVSQVTALTNAILNQYDAQQKLISAQKLVAAGFFGPKVLVEQAKALEEADSQVRDAIKGIEDLSAVTGKSKEEIIGSMLAVLKLTNALLGNTQQNRLLITTLEGVLKGEQDGASATDQHREAIEKQIKALRDQRKEYELQGQLREERIRGAVAEIASLGKLSDAQIKAELQKRRQPLQFGFGLNIQSPLDQAIKINQQIANTEKVLNEIISPRDKKPELTEVERLSRAYRKLADDIKSFSNLAAPEFVLRFKVEGLERTKRDFEHILDLRRDLGKPLDAPLPAYNDPAAIRANIQGLEREKRVKEQIEELTRSEADAEDRLTVATERTVEATKAYNDLLDQGAKNKSLAAELGDREAKQVERIRDAELQTQALREERYRRQGRPTLQKGLGLSLDPEASRLLERDLLEQATLYNQAVETRIEGARKASLFEENVRRDQLGKFYEESATRKAIVAEETAARQKASNDASEQIRRNEVILQQGLIELAVDLGLARSNQAVERLRHERETTIAITLLDEDLAKATVRDAEYVARVLKDAERARKEDRKQTIDSLINLEEELRKYQANDPETLEAARERAGAARLQASISLKEKIIELEGEISNAGVDASDRYRVAWLEAIQAVQDADVQAVESQIASQVKLADATVLHSEQVRARVLEHLAQQKSVTEGWADGIIGVYDRITGALDKGIDRLTGGLTLVNSLLKSITHQLVNRLFQRFLDAFFPAGGSGGAIPVTGSQTSSGSGGGIGGFFRNLLGNVLRPGGGVSIPGIGPGGTATFNPATLSSLFTGNGESGITAPTSIGERSAKATEVESILHSATKAGVSTATRATGGNVGLAAQLATMAPLLGFSLGSQLGGQSALGQILGGAGGAIAGLGITLSGGIAGLFNPITAIPAVALLAISYVLGKKKQRDADERARTELSGNVYNDTIAVLNALRAGKMTGTEGLSQYEQIKSNYLAQASQLKDSKTRRIAQEWLSRDFAPFYDPLIRQAAAASDQAKTIDDRLIPEFATGGLVPYRHGLQTLIKVRPEEMVIPPDTDRGWMVPGVDRGVDSVFMYAKPKTRILTKQQQKVHGFALGGEWTGDTAVSGPGQPPGGRGGRPIVLNAYISFNGKAFVLDTLESDEAEEIQLNLMGGYEGQKVSNRNRRNARTKGLR